MIKTVSVRTLLAMMLLILAWSTSQAHAKGGTSHSSSSHSSSSSRSSGSRPSSSRPSSNSRPSNSRPSGNSRPAPRRVVVKRAPRNAQNNRPIRPRGKYRAQVIGGRTFLRQGNRLYNTRCCLRGRPYLVYYGTVGNKHKSHAWIWIVLGVVAVLILAGVVWYFMTNRRRI